MTWFSWLLLILCVTLYLRVLKLSLKSRKIREVEYLLENQRHTILDLYAQLQKQLSLVEELTERLNQKSIGRKKYAQRKLTEAKQDIFTEVNNINTVVSQEHELVEAYNSTEPSSLLNSAIKVSVKPESTTSINKNEPIILASIGNGNYCLVHYAEINYWLIPKVNLKIDQYRYETVKLLFECDGYELEHDNYWLDKPAKVSMLPNGREWKLEEQGLLRFFNSLYEDIIESYNDDPSLLNSHVITKVSLAITNQKIILKKAVNYNYLIIDNDNEDYWLVPKEQIKIDYLQYQEIKNLFDCDSYKENNSNFILVQPAKVSPILEQIHWQLEARGKIRFV